MSDLVFVVEACQNCKEHGWNTRHDEAKYQEFFKKVAQCIIDRIPSAMIMKNQIPKQYLNYDIYNNLVQNDDETCPYYQQVPRTGAFEVSYKGLLIFSKLKGGYWPNCELVADKCYMVVQEESQGNDCTQYLAGNTPLKGGGFTQSTKKGTIPEKKQTNGQSTQPTPQKKQPKKIEQNNNVPEEEEQQLIVNENNQPPVESDKISVQSKFHQSNTGTQVQVDTQTICGSHLNTSNDLAGFPVFPKGTKSLLSKCLTKDIWNQLKDQKDKHGFSFKDAIFSGCKNTDSGIGVYAGSHDSYKIFAPLMDQIIDQYHNHKKNDVHQAESSKVTLNAPDFPPEEAKMILSTRIRVGRNLDGFPLGPGLVTQEQRAAVEQKVTTALKSFDGELKGKYYSLESLTEEERNQLIQDHFLFKEGDRFLEACGLNRDWPKNRGIFHNDSKTFLTWVNEEDQLRIISMQPGSNIRQVFERLTTALQKFEKVAKFSYDDHLGFITSCPTNLGTAMRASVHIHLPLLSQNKQEFQAIADKYNVQIRGAHGEHTETNDGIFDISNIRRLGRSMTLLVQDMYDGVKAMIKRELELQNEINKKNTLVKAGPHLKKPEDIYNMVEFPPETHSLLSKYLTLEVYNKYRGQKDKAGVSFEQMILSGCQNVDSGIGCYAGSHDSYYTFSDLFDNVIEDYHKHGKNDKHVSDMDYTKLNCPPFTNEEAAMIQSTRIRVGRNLADFPLGPGISREQRNEVEKLVSGALSHMEGELQGSYYSLTSLSEADRKQLIEDHFLFKEGDRFLESCGLNRNWPEGRGIFHNKEKTFLVWINEEDQLRIISMQKGADILAVFTRLSRAAAEIEKVSKFAHDDHLGYITSCPTNLGTALRASVHVKLPFLAKNKAKFQEIADKYYVQIRGIHGEHTETDDGVFDISNKRRLGRSERELVQDMYDGVKAMIHAEFELSGQNQQKQEVVIKNVQAGPHLKKPEDITGIVEFPQGTKSLLCKYLTQDVYMKYRGQKDKAGVSFEQMILSGCQNVDSGIGCYAGSHDSYYTFSDLFDNVIEDYHKHGKMDKHVSDMDYTKLNCPPFLPEEAAMIISTRIRVGRNLAGFPLGPGISREQRNEVENLVSSALQSMTDELQGSYYALNSLTDQDRQQLINDHFLFKEGDRFLESCGLNRDWPEGRGIFHNKEKTFLVWVNEEDQLRIISMQPGADILSVFTRLSKAASSIEKVSKFAHDDHLGYITSCPTNLGTALRASVHVKLPLLAKNKAKFQEIADKYYVQIRGIHGEHTETDDGVFDISNKRRLGRSERELVQDMYDGVKAMIHAEFELAKPVIIENIKAGPHLKKPEDITGFVEFPVGTKSLLSKYLTKDIYLKYRHQQDQSGVPFELMILSGSQNIDSGIGCYAGSHDSYYAFSEFFDKVIEDYHKHGKNDKHISDMDYKKLNCPPLTEEQAGMIVSTRIRVGRNLADFPLGPGITREQRNEVEKIVSGVLSQMTGELQGSYYSLTSLSEADRKQLIEDHFLFKEGDRFLESCGLNRDWPEGRGIFHNKEKTFLVWINEEDQLRIISMQKGADILAVFTRLSRAAAEIEKVAKFSQDDHLGYITSCPTNLGTALRASVHVKLPLLSKNKEKFQEIADKYYVQIRGIHGEHTETDDGVFDISNKRRLGRSERDLVQDMYDGVKAMINAEIELKQQLETLAGPHLKKPEDIVGMVKFPEGTHSLLSKYLTREVFHKYQQKKDKAGVSFEQMILSGCQNVDSGIGCYAGSHDSYYTFSDLFDNVIEDYHKHGKNDKHISDMDYTQLNCPPFTEEENNMIVSTRIRVGRNLADFPLGPGISREQRNEVEKIVSGVLSQMTGELQGSYYALTSLSDEDRKLLIEHHFLFKEGDRFLESCGLNRDWPEGRGIFHNKEKTFLVWINEEDQLRIISMQLGSDIKQVFSRLSIAASEIEKVAKFAHDDHLGYITSCPTNLGTALRASVHIKLPLLAKNKEKFQEIADKYYVQIRGIHGEHTESDDGVFDISNKRRLGRSERDLVQDMYDGVKAMIHAELELSKQ